MRGDPTAEVRGLRLEARRPKALDDAALRRLLRQVHQEGDLRDIALVELLVGTGLRISETLDLRRGTSSPAHRLPPDPAGSRGNAQSVALPELQQPAVKMSRRGKHRWTMSAITRRLCG